MTDPNTASTCQSFYECVDHWQTLIGTFIGGLMSLWVAKLVSKSAQRTDDLTATYIIIGDLIHIAEMIKISVAKAEVGENLSKDDKDIKLAELLHYFRVRPSALFEHSISRIMHHDEDLTSLLHLASTIIRSTDPILDRIDEDILMIERNQQLQARGNDRIVQDMQIVRVNHENLLVYTKLAIHMLEEIILKKRHYIYRFRRKYIPTNMQKQIASVLHKANSQQ